MTTFFSPSAYAPFTTTCCSILGPLARLRAERGRTDTLSRCLLRIYGINGDITTSYPGLAHKYRKSKNHSQPYHRNPKHSQQSTAPQQERENSHSKLKRRRLGRFDHQFLGLGPVMRIHGLSSVERYERYHLRDRCCPVVQGDHGNA